MKLLRKLAFYGAWVCLILGHRLADLARDGVGEADDFARGQGWVDADEYKVGGTSDD